MRNLRQFRSNPDTALTQYSELVAAMLLDAMAKIPECQVGGDGCCGVRLVSKLDFKRYGIHAYYVGGFFDAILVAAEANGWPIENIGVDNNFLWRLKG